MGFRNANWPKRVCPACGGKGKRQVGSVDDTPLFQRCARCNGTGEVRAVLVKAVRGSDAAEVLRWNPDEPLDDSVPYMRLSQTAKENNVSKETYEASEVQVTDEELMIAARIGITREQLLNQKAMDLLEPDELLLMRAGLKPVEILAARIVR